MVRQCGWSFHLCLIVDGHALIQEADGTRTQLTGPAGAFLDPCRGAELKISPRSTWYWLAFDPLYQSAPWNRRGHGKHHPPGLENPSSREVWGCEPPLLVRIRSSKPLTLPTHP
jgi:hypothetical protein